MKKKVNQFEPDLFVIGGIGCAWPTRKKKIARKKHTRKCKICGSEGHYAKIHSRYDPELKKCSRCREIKSKDEFAVMRTLDLGDNVAVYRTSVCASCEKKRTLTRNRFTSLTARIKTIFQRVKRECRNEAFATDLTLEFLFDLFKNQKGLCHYSGCPMLVASGFDSISLDRIDSNKDYTKDNVVFCRWIINSMKSSFPLEKFLSTCREVVSHNDERKN